MNLMINKLQNRFFLATTLFLLAFANLAVAGAPPLVDVAWVKAHSCDKGVRVLDIRNALDGHSRTDYLRGHIPCAVYTDYLKDGWRTADKNGTPGQLPPVEKLEKLIGSLGIDNNTHVVIVPAGTNALDMGSATRIYWTFKVLGHDNVSILNGGLAAYARDPKNKLEKGNNKPPAVAFKAHFRRDMVASKDDVLAASKKGEMLVDNRPNDQYIGINRHPKAKRNGTIPGAVNLPESWLTENNGGSFRNTESLRKLYAIAGVPTQGEQITFCNTGHWASLGWFASHELLGNDKVKLYDGSMVEWSADKNLPMEVKAKM